MAFNSIRSSLARQVFSKRSLSTATTAKVVSPFARLLPVMGGAAIAGTILYYNYASAEKVKAESKRTLIGDDSWVDLKLAKVVPVSHNTKKYIFSLPEEDQVFGLETAGCCLTRFKQDNGKFVIRPYTPISDPDLKGIVEFVIKIYPTGKMGNHIDSLKINETLAFKGTILKYKWESNKHKEIALLGAGSGITPLYQLMHAIDRNPDDKTKVTLLYGNVTEGDILIKEELDALVKKNPNQFKIKYFVDKPSNDWKGESGFITKDVLQKTIFPASADNVKVFVCGPPPFYDAISGNKVSPQDQGELVGVLKDLGFTKEQVFKF